MKFFSIFLAFLLLPLVGRWEGGFLSAQTLSGIVTDTVGKPMPFTTIYVESQKLGTTTDGKGHYELKGLKPGKFTMQVSYIGYRTQEHEVELKKDSILNCQLEEESIVLDEYVVLPGGMDMGQYVLKQMEKNIKPLKSRLTSYDCTVMGQLGKSIDLSTLPKRKTIRFALSLLGWGKIFDILVKYPDLEIQMAEDVTFRKGSIKSSDPRLVSIKPKVADKELKSIFRKDWFLDANTYDMFYDHVKSRIKLIKKGDPDYALHYSGSYTENGRSIHIIKFDKTQVEVVDGTWQIRRARYKSGTRTMYFEFHELLPDVFIPITGQAQFNLDYDGFPHGTVSMSLSYNYRNLKK